MDRPCLLTLLLLYSASGLSVGGTSVENETNRDPQTHVISSSQDQIVTAQYECFQKIMKEDGLPKKDSICSRTWDGWLCWEDTEAGFTTEQHCPGYYDNFDTTEVAFKVCTEAGEWGRHPESNRTWTNYTQCSDTSKESEMVGLAELYNSFISMQWFDYPCNSFERYRNMMLMIQHVTHSVHVVYD